MKNSIPQNTTPLKHCHTCPEEDQWHPATAEYFHKNARSRDGLNNICKACNSAKSSAHKAKKRREKPPKEKSTHCLKGHPLAEGNLGKHYGHNRCLTCHREQETKRQRQKGVKERIKKDCCAKGHPLVEGNLKKDKRGRKQCLTCHKESGKRRYHKDPRKAVAQATSYAKKHREQINKRMGEYRTREIPRMRARASSMRQRAKKFDHYTKLCQKLNPLEGDELVSKLHRNSAYLERRAALASTLDTSGHSDKVPVLDQSCRTSNVRIAIFLAPTRSAWSV